MELDPVWKALGDPTRRHILDLLREHPRTTGELCDAFPALTDPAVIKHVKILDAAGLLRVEARGRERWNHLNGVPLQEIAERWLKPYEAVWASKIWRLQRAAELPIHAEETPTMPDQTTARLVQVDQDVVIAAPPERVFEVLTADIGAWWGAPYIHGDPGTVVTLQRHLGGHLMEDWGDGEGVSWAVVKRLRRPHVLELSGRFMMPGSVDGSAIFDLIPEGQSTRIRFSHTAVGAISDQTAADWSAGWDDLIAHRMKSLVETGVVTPGPGFGPSAS